MKDTSEAAWRQAIESTKKTHHQLIKAVAAFPDSRLADQVPGKTENYHNFFYMFSGIVQHELYHAGQIALLKKSQSELISEPLRTFATFTVKALDRSSPRNPQSRMRI